MRRLYTAKQAAELAGVHAVTLQRWIAAGRVTPTYVLHLKPGKVIYCFSEADAFKLRDERQRKPKGKGKAR